MQDEGLPVVDDVSALPTYEQVKASGTKPEADVHLWMRFGNLVCCAWCGSTNRKLGRPCKGVVRVELRTEPDRTA
jgi:hypothetical protein